MTEGWWNIAPRGCETLLQGPRSRRASIMSMRSTTTAAASGPAAPSCAPASSEFTIRGVEDCLARGFDRTGFFEVDTGEQKSWTIQLTDPSRPGSAPAAPR